MKRQDPFDSGKLGFHGNLETVFNAHNGPVRR
jgi:hypothetical protein